MNTLSQPDNDRELADDNASGDDLALQKLLDRPDPEDAPAGDAPAGDDVDADDLPDDDTPPGDNPDDDDPEIAWKAGDKEYRIKRSELTAGYMKDADYRQKTTALAEQRKLVETQAQQVALKQQQAVTQLDVLIEGLYTQLVGDQKALQRLIDEDPQEYLRQQAAMTQRANQLQLAMQQRQAVQGQLSQDEQRQRSEWRQGERERLLEKLPHWRDEKKRTAESDEIASYLNDIGYTADELGELVDHRALLVARDAARYRALQRAKQQKQQPSQSRPIKPGAPRAGNTSTARYDEALAKARKTGRPEDIERALMLKGT